MLATENDTESNGQVTTVIGLIVFLLLAWLFVTGGHRDDDGCAQPSGHENKRGGRHD